MDKDLKCTDWELNLIRSKHVEKFSFGDIFIAILSIIAKCLKSQYFIMA